jgi:hypothetical protein
VQLDDALGDGEPEPGAALLLRVGAVDLMELMEYPRLLGGRNAGTGIDDRDREHTIGHAGGNAHLAVIGELDGVAHEIEQDLGDAPLVALAERHLVGHFHLQRQLLGRRQRFRCRHDGQDDVLHRVLLEAEHELAGFDLG